MAELARFIPRDLHAAYGRVRSVSLPYAALIMLGVTERPQTH
jgi:hypothetical protein